MRKVFKRIPFYKVFVLLFVTLYTFLPSVQAVGVVMENYAKEEDTTIKSEVKIEQEDVKPEVYTEEEEKIDTGEDILDKGISDPAYIANPGEENIPKYTYEDGVYRVFTVIEGEEYVYPDNEDVRVKFTSVTEKGNLVISRVTLTEEQKEELNTSDNYGWDISSTMSNGSFSYDLTLPNTQGDDVEVKYTEDGNTYESIDDVVVNEGVIYIEGLEHFTVFVVVDSPDQTKCDAVQLETTPYVTCFPTIQQAVIAASDGDTIYVAPGTYNEYVSIYGKAVNLIGSGADVTTINDPHTGAVITVENFTTSTSMTIEGFTISAETAGRGIVIQNNISNVTVKNNKIINFTENGVVISNSNNNSVLSNTITTTSDANAGVYVDNGSEDNLIDENTVSLPTSGSKNLYNTYFAGSISGNNTVSNNILEGGKSSFQQDGGVTGITTFSGNTIESPSFAGAHLNGGSAEISGNTFNNAVRPIEFWAQDVNIQNNVIDDSTYDGINAHSYNSVTANYNTFSNIGFKAVNNQVPAKTIDARYNKWGTSKESIIQSMINGDVMYDPWYGKDVTQSLTINEYENGGIYYVGPNDTLDFNISGEPVYYEKYIAGLWGYNSGTESRTSDRYIGWNYIYPDSLDLVNSDEVWDMVTTGWMGSSAPGTVIPAGDYLLWIERYYDEGGYVQGSTITKRVTVDKTPPSVPVLESPIDRAYINDNTPLMQWANSSDDYSGVKAYYYRVYRNCTDINDSSTCSGVYPTSTGLWRTNSEYQAGTTSDGTYYWQVMAEDNAGNQSAWSDLEEVTIDTKASDAPKITFPLAESYFTSSPILNEWTGVTDSSGIAFYRIEYIYDDEHTFSGGPYRTTTSTSRNHTPNIGEQGGVTIRVQAVDNAGNESGWSDPVHYTYDETDPAVPTNLSFETIEGDVLGCGISTNEYTIVATWDASNDDDSGIAYYEYMSFNPTTGWVWGPKNVGNVTERQGSFTVGEGTYGFAVRAVDLAGNASDWTSLTLEDSCQITYDSQAPVSNINIIGNLAETKNLNHNNGWHGDGWYYDFAEVKLEITTGSALDTNEKIQYQILDDNVTCPTPLSSPTEITSGTNIESTVNSLTDGVHTLCYQAKDSAGNLESIQKEVLKLDRTQPEYEILTNTINGNEVNDVYYISSDTIEVDVHGEDNHSGYFRTRYDLFEADENWNCSNRIPNSVDLPDAINDKTQTLSLSGLDDGRYCMQIWVYDDVQNKSWIDKNGISTIHFIIDNTPPAIPTATLTANGLPVLTNGYTNSETFTFDLSSTDPIRYQLKYWNDILGSSYKESTPWNPTNLSAYSSALGVYNDTFTQGEGKHYFAFSACDIANNCSDFSTPFVVTYDHTEPTSTITSPSSGYITNTTPEIIGYTEDTYSVDYVVLSYTTYNEGQCGTEWTELATLTNENKETLRYDWSYNDWSLEDGIYCIKAQGTDLAENTEETAVIENITYDKTAPQITLLEIIITGLLSVTAEDITSGTKKIEVRIGEDGEWLDYEEGMNLNDLVNNEPGTYKIYVRVTDNAGNVIEDHRFFTIPSPPPTTAKDVLGAIITPQPVQASEPQDTILGQSTGTGGYVYAQTTDGEEETEEEEETDDTEVEEEKDVKGTEDENDVEEEQEGRPWWVYPLIILPLLLLFIILWKRRKEDEEPQY